MTPPPPILFLTDMLLHIVAGMVADMVADKVAGMVANMEQQKNIS